MDLMDARTPTAASNPEEQKPLWTSACLAEKLQKLKDTPKPNIDAMECESEELKKRSWAKEARSYASPTKEISINGTFPQDIKRSCNGATPPPIASAHARHNQAQNQATLTTDLELSHKDNNGDVMEPIDEEDESKTGNEAADEIEEVPKETEEQQYMKVESTKPEDTEAAASDNNEQEETDDEASDKDAKPPVEPQPQEDAKEAETILDKSSDKEPPPIKQVDPHTWQELHGNWLHAAVRAAMGDITLTTIPDLENVEQVEHPVPNMHYEVVPRRTVIKRYDLRLLVQKGNDQVNLFHQVFTQWYNKVREVDNKAVIYPCWASDDRRENLINCIENPTDIPLNLPLLKKFVHKLFLRTTGGDYHVQVLMGSEEEFPTIIQTIGWWLKSTSQGMWITDLQSAEETTCAGWLLFSVGDYDQEALSKEIWDFTGVQVVVCFREIEDGKKRDPKQKPDPNTPKPPPRSKPFTSRLTR